jgi:monoterpene epsilon-lactone hydrolase
MSVEQRESLESSLRQLPFDLAGDIEEQRHLFEKMMSSQPPPADVVVTSAALGAVPAAEITVAGAEPRNVVLYFHGGAYALGTAASAADLAAQIGRRTDATVISVDYRLAPEHPYPAAVDDAVTAYAALLDRGVAPARIVVAGESAGAGLAVAALVAARDRALPMPAAAFLMSPWVDLTLTGETMDSKRGIDPMLAREGLAARAADYAGSHDPAAGLISPIFADLSGLPPLVIQAGSHEVLLDDAIRLAQRAAAADVVVTLDVTPAVPHVFQAFHAVLDEGASALDRAGRFLQGHLATSEPLPAH